MRHCQHDSFRQVPTDCVVTNLVPITQKMDWILALEDLLHEIGKDVAHGERGIPGQNSDVANRAVTCPLFSVRPAWESVGFGAGAVIIAFGGGFVVQAGVPAHVVVFAAGVGELDPGVQQAGERSAVQQLVALA